MLLAYHSGGLLGTGRWLWLLWSFCLFQLFSIGLLKLWQEPTETQQAELVGAQAEAVSHCWAHSPQLCSSSTRPFPGPFGKGTMVEGNTTLTQQARARCVPHPLLLYFSRRLT